MIKRIWIGFLALILCGCGSSNDALEHAMEFRANVLNANGCSFRICATADFSDMTYTFQMDCETDEKGNLQFTVLAPEYIAGITGNIQFDGGKLCFGDVIFAFPIQNEGYLTPVAGPWILLRAIRSGYIRHCGMEDGLLRMTVDDSYEEDALTLDIWLDQDLKPIQADIYENNQRIMSMRIEMYQLL